MNRFRRLAYRARLVHLSGGDNGREQALLMLTDALATIDPITDPPEAAAELLARTERVHLKVCSRHRTGDPAPGPQRRDGWLFLLQKIAGRRIAPAPGNSSTLRLPPGSSP